MNATTTTGGVVVGVDGSPASIDAVRWAVRYARLTRAKLEAVTSWVTPQTFGTSLGIGFETSQVDWEATAREVQQTALSQALPDGLDGLTRTVVGEHPAAALTAAAQGADLLVVGSRGHGGFAGMLLGSVSGHVTAHASCPVVVVRHRDATPGHEEQGAVPTTADTTSERTDA